MDQFNAERLGGGDPIAMEYDYEGGTTYKEALPDDEVVAPPPRKRQATSSSITPYVKLTPTQPIGLPPAWMGLTSMQPIGGAKKTGQPPKSNAPQPCRVVRPWETLTFDVASWKHTLDMYGVDEEASQELWLLAQHSEEGARCANSIISKLIKKAHDRVTIEKPSACVHSCCLKARLGLS